MKCTECNGTGRSIYGYNQSCFLCNGSGIIEPLSNEEWFDTLSTEEKARVLRRKTYGNGEENEREEQGWVNWLQAKHEDNPPDIPSVPSWDRWLQGEKTKCEYCDGTNAGCNLVGRFECPKTPKTEQEYLQTCNTEQLIRFLLWYPYNVHGYPKPKMSIAEEEDSIREWLKQPHTTKE